MLLIFLIKEQECLLLKIICVIAIILKTDLLLIYLKAFIN